MILSQLRHHRPAPIPTTGARDAYFALQLVYHIEKETISAPGELERTWMRLLPSGGPSGLAPLVASLALSLSAADSAQSPRTLWPDTLVGRLATLALSEQLNGELLASHSATATLEAWCTDHHMAADPHIEAVSATGAVRAAPPDVRAALSVSMSEPLRYRRVALTCGTHVLSEAENWYVPSRLSPAMNHLLNATKTPFGKAIISFHPSRQTLAVEWLWSPLPGGWEMHLHEMSQRSAGAIAMPLYLFRHRAVVLSDAHVPLAYVIETYTSAVLDFPH